MGETGGNFDSHWEIAVESLFFYLVSNIFCRSKWDCDPYFCIPMPLAVGIANGNQKEWKG